MTDDLTPELAAFADLLDAPSPPDAAGFLCLNPGKEWERNALGIWSTGFSLPLVRKAD